MSAASFKRALDCIIKGNARAIINSKVVAMKQLEGQHKQRIFVDGRDEDGSVYGSPPVAKGKLIGVYGKAQGRKRQRRGRQTSKKDLVLRGDLLRNIQVGTSSGDIVYGFLTDRTKLIAEGQEGQTDSDIFNASKKESANVRKAFVNTYRKELEKCAKK